MSSTVVAHAGEPTQFHVLVDSLLGVGFGVTAVVLFYLVLRFVVAPDHGKESGG